MASYHKGLTLQEIENMLSQEDSCLEDDEENVDIVIIPPYVDELTDNENIEEDQTDFEDERKWLGHLNSTLQMLLNIMISICKLLNQN